MKETGEKLRFEATADFRVKAWRGGRGVTIDRNVMKVLFPEELKNMDPYYTKVLPTEIVDGMKYYDCNGNIIFPRRGATITFPDKGGIFTVPFSPATMHYMKNRGNPGDKRGCLTVKYNRSQETVTLLNQEGEFLMESAVKTEHNFYLLMGLACKIMK